MNYEEALVANAAERHTFDTGPKVPDQAKAAFVTCGQIGNVKKLREVYIPKILSGELDVNCTEERGRTSFQMAVWYGHVEFAKLLLEHGAKYDTWDTDLWSPLHYAAEWDKGETVELLLALGDDMHKKDNNGVSPRMAADRMNAGKAREVFESASTPSGMHEITAKHNLKAR